jgi:hypothetical protein
MLDNASGRQWKRLLTGAALRSHPVAERGAFDLGAFAFSYP